MNKTSRAESRGFLYAWLGYLGSNQGMSGSEPDALPLGYTPIS